MDILEMGPTGSELSIENKYIYNKPAKIRRQKVDPHQSERQMLKHENKGEGEQSEEEEDKKQEVRGEQREALSFEALSLCL